MKISILMLVAILNKTFASGGEKKSVHFKIHVPEIIKHHIHTKTVFIHVHEMKPHEDSKKHKTESHVEDWTSYNSYNYKDGVEENHDQGYHRKKQKQQQSLSPYDDYLPMTEDDYQPYGPPYGYEMPDNFLTNEPQSPPANGPVAYYEPEEMVDPRVHLSTPMQYAIHEDVQEEPPSKDVQQVHEQSYHRGMESESGRVEHKDLKEFYDKDHEEGHYDKGGYENDAYNNYANHGYQGKYDKEIGIEQRSGKKRPSRRYFIAKMVVR